MFKGNNMKRKWLLDYALVANTAILFFGELYFELMNAPIELRAILAVFLIPPIVITLYKKRLDNEKIERQKIINKAMKLRPLLVKLERIRSVSNIGNSLTYRGIMFIDKEISYLGWRRYFDKYGNVMSDKFDAFQSELELFINETEKVTNEEFSRILNSFYWLTSHFRHLYDDLAKMIELAGKRPPKEDLKEVEELEENCKNFFEALKELCDEVEEIGEVFSGRYPLTPLREISTIHLPRR